jgi:hypothetical protein
VYEPNHKSQLKIFQKRFCSQLFLTLKKTIMANVFKGKPPVKKNKVVMFSEIRKGTKFIHPISEEVCFVNFKDETCIAYGPTPSYITTYVRQGDADWSLPIELN